ncbi:putative deoxyguanosinetriphosphate triphosphohydrolase [Alkaliphilus metalliredigens QYMF]|uniref:Putative deoxyguanosinetriphosphate triphosphohydrolase n=1 Tax=Alkaliphilus metalliredigens (strain QYMF) TaxID=293826 RepID=A6TSH2_ALKMQ|nr:deoxyguanosinetriphosphate triphosphohydrolase [Alkaliphilus metalliredigens]ABR49140.1 putative deoxyguanosinetriphosphate triphosphohydrolase [Alkaliphilus metalliredigens QYMF]
MRSPKEVTEALEVSYLAPVAQKSKESKGRRIPETECDIRTIYQRDRDRIIHSKSFRKLKGKTQVFIVKNDLMRTRLTHTLEVSQIARTIGRALRINEDLIEAIAMGHDLGHTCFGHCGEEVLHQLTGHFKHNEQSLRVVDQLERNGKGLNLTLEVRDGILNHTGPNAPITLEGKLVKIVDRLTYLCHDIQDSIDAGILSIDELPKDTCRILGTRHSDRINTFVVDMINETQKKLQEGGEVRVYQSDLVKQAMIELRTFMFERIYRGEISLIEKKKAKLIVELLYQHFSENPEKLPEEYRNLIKKEGLMRAVADYIAGCTDFYAIQLFEKIFLPKSR